MALKIAAILAGLETEIERRIRELLAKTEILRLGNADELLSATDNLTNQNVHLLLAGPVLQDVSAIELAQSLKMQFPGRACLFMSSSAHAIPQADLFKNGFDDAFFLPLDGSRLNKTLSYLENHLIGEASREMCSVALDGLVAGTQVDFDVMVFLPLNQRYVKLFKKGSIIRAEVLTKFAAQDVRVIFISESAKVDYENYVRQHQTAAAAEKLLDRSDRIQQSVLSLFHSLQVPDQGTFESGKDLVQNAQKLTTELVTNPDVADVLEGVFGNIGREQGDHYDQALRVSQYASIFSTLLKVGNPQDLAMAGLFHHIGLSAMPEKLLHQEYASMSKEEQLTFGKHPSESLRLMKEKKMILTPEVSNAILFHHERPDGTGFPKGATEVRIPKEAALLAIADAFDELTCLKPGRPRLSPKEAFTRLTAAGIAPNELLFRLSAVFEAA